MKIEIKNLIAAIAVTFVLASVAFAQQPTIVPWVIEQPLIQHPVVVQPSIPQLPVETVIEQPVQGIQTVEPQSQLYVRPEPVLPLVQSNPYYFGMSVALKRDRWGRTTLRIVSVTAGSPVATAGLEIGDEIRRVNGHGFQQATDSFDAVRLMNSYVKSPVRTSGGPAPAAALSFLPTSPLAWMEVRNVRNGRDVSINVYPTTNGNGVAPAAPAVVPAIR